MKQQAHDNWQQHQVDWKKNRKVNNISSASLARMSISSENGMHSCMCGKQHSTYDICDTHFIEQQQEKRAGKQQQ